MLKTVTVREQIDLFLAEKRLAIVGVSRSPTDFTRVMMREFVNRGYDVVPVNPAVDSLDGRPCFARVQDILPPVRAVLIMTPPKITEQVIRDCLQAGVKQVWFHKGVGPGAASAESIAYGREHGIGVIPGFCPFMFFEQTAWFHRGHAALLRLSGGYPNRIQQRPA